MLQGSICLDKGLIDGTRVAGHQALGRALLRDRAKEALKDGSGEYPSWVAYSLGPWLGVMLAGYVGRALVSAAAAAAHAAAAERGGRATALVYRAARHQLVRRPRSVKRAAAGPGV